MKSSARITFQEKLLFTKHLSVMVKSGITLPEALSTLTNQPSSPNLKKVITSLSRSLENGQALSVSMEELPKSFDKFYTSLIKVGEESGTLEENLEFLTKQLEKNFNLQKKIKSALLYPGLVVSASLIMGGFIAFFVLPKLVDFFDTFHTTLPLSTRVLLFFAQTSKDYGLLIFLVLLALSFLISFILRQKKVRPRYHHFLLKIPIVGPIIKSSQLALFSRNLGVLIKSGIPIDQGMEITSKTLSNLKLQSDLLAISQSLKKGQKISQTMSQKEYSVFPPLVSKMIGIGEKTGRLDEVLLYLAEFFEDELDNNSQNLSTVLEPILLIFIGLMVAFVALAVISPIYQLTGSIRK